MQYLRFTSASLRIVTLLVAAAPGALSGADGPWADAAVVWHMDGAHRASGPSSDLVSHGQVRLGVELQGEEREASLCRGGDGRVAVFEEGYLVAGNAPGRPALDGSREMTLCMRIRDPRGSWDSPLLSTARSGEETSGILYGAQLDRSQIGFRETDRIREDTSLEFLWRANLSGRAKSEWNLTEDFDKGLLRLAVPVELIRPQDWHDVIVRFQGPRLELFIDGVCVDEEWPHGTIRDMNGPYLIGAGWERGQVKSAFRGQVDHVAFWNRALDDREIETLSGGSQEIARRALEILGPECAEVQYWRPRGHNAFVGDVMMFYHEGRLHVFYLFDRRHHGSKWGTGAHQFAHLSTRDLVQWEHHPMALPITDPTECSLGTGCFAFRDDTYYLYYIQHARRLALADAPYPGDNIFVATSRDGIHFTKNPRPVVLMNYRNGGDINPHLIPTETGSRYLMTISGWKVFASDNLMDWTEVDVPQLSSIKWICTTSFQWNDWRYFTGCGHYVMSGKPIEETHEWITPASQALQDAVGVPVVCEFTGNRRIYAGFVSGSYAQELVFRELVQEPDGTLGMKWPEEMIPKSGDAIALRCTSVRGETSVANNSVRLSAKDDFACVMMSEVPQNFRLTLRAKPDAGVLNFGVCCRGHEAYATGCELRFEPVSGRMQYSRPVQGEPGKDSRDGSAMDPIPGLDREFTIDMIVKDDLVDVCIGGRRTLINRHAAEGDRLFFFVRNGAVFFEEIQIRPLLSQPRSNNRIIPGELLFANSDFEAGDLTNWTASGDAFDHLQPTQGDNTLARGASPSRHQGRFWVGTYERFNGRTGQAGDARGDAATGTLESVKFTIEQPFISFLISGGRFRNEEYVALVVDGQEIKRATGHQTETLRHVVWDVTSWRGKQAHLLVADRSQKAWGVVNVDDFRYCTPGRLTNDE
ncbi:MAG: LamG-like jellyroll fold domain-containing protein [Pirellulaceae bacterium]